MKKLNHNKKITHRFSLALILGFLLLIFVAIYLSYAQINTDLRSKAASALNHSDNFKQAVVISESSSGLYTPLLLPNNQFTVEMWLKFKPFTTDQTKPYYIFTSKDLFSGVETSMFLSGNKSINNGNAILQAIVWGSTPYQISSPVKLKPNVWYHIAMVKSLSAYNIYINGDRAITQPYTGTPTYAKQSGLTIGGYPIGTWGDPYFKFGDILIAELDELRVSKSVRYTRNFKVNKTVFRADSDTLALYHFDQNLSNAVPRESSLTLLPGYKVTFIKSTISK